MKRKIYILSFTIFGALLGFFVHGILEIFVIKLMLSDFDKYSLGWSWDTWMLIHSITVGVFMIGLGIWGYVMGKRCWKYLYIDQKAKRWGLKLKRDF